MNAPNGIEQLAVEMAAMRREIANLARIQGARLTRLEVCERLCIHRNTLRTYVDSRGFPRCGRDGKWLLADVMEWEFEQRPLVFSEADSEQADTLDLPAVDGRTTYLYRHFDAEGQLLYVGISLSALTRLGQHKENAQWYGRIARVEIQTFPSRAAALHAEREAVRTEQPSFNIKLQPRRAA